MSNPIQNVSNLRSLLCGAVVIAALSGLALSGCNNSGGGSAGMSDSDAKKFSTRVDPNNPPPEAVAAMAKMRQQGAPGGPGKGAPAAPNAPISTPPPK